MMVQQSEFMRELSDAIGASAAMSVVRVFGGGRIYVPKPTALDDQHPLTVLLGRPLAVRLCDRLGGERFEVPRAAAVEVRLRNDEIARRFLQGKSIRQIAIAFGISKSAVWNVIRKVQFVPPDKPAA